MAEKRTILNRPTISAPFLSSNLTFVLENKPILILGPLICPGETILNFRCYKKVSPNAKLEHNTFVWSQSEILNKQNHACKQKDKLQLYSHICAHYTCIGNKIQYWSINVMYMCFQRDTQWPPPFYIFLKTVTKRHYQSPILRQIHSSSMYSLYFCSVHFIWIAGEQSKQCKRKWVKNQTELLKNRGKFFRSR